MKSHKPTLRRTLFCLLLPLFLCSIVVGQVKWPAWDNDKPEPHTIFGVPEYVDHDPNHNIVREYSAFTVYYDDEILSPRWTAIKMTHYVADRNSKIKRPSRFKTDAVLRKKGYEVTNHDDYKNPTGSKLWNRGHMVQFDDARGYSKEAATDSFYTTNICPQLAEHNQRGWLTLEETCTEFARDYNVVWIYSGPIYGEHKVPFASGRKIPKPQDRRLTGRRRPGGCTGISYAARTHPAQGGPVGVSC